MTCGHRFPRLWALVIFLIFLGVTFCVGLEWFQKSPPPPLSPPLSEGQEPEQDRIRVTVVETIRNSATVLVYVRETNEDLWLRAKVEGKSLLLTTGDFKKKLTFECEITVSHSEYINHAREAGPALILELLFNANL